MNTRIVKRSINRMMIAGVILIGAFLRVYPSYTTPPHDKSFHRKQKIDYSFDERDLLRIWIGLVGQGDTEPGGSSRKSKV